MAEMTLGTPFTAGNGFRFVVYDIDDALQKPERRPIIKNYFYENTLNMIYGQAGCGKTWWAIQEAISITLGKKLLDLDIEKDPDGMQVPHRVLYISLEMTVKDIADRIKEVMTGLGLDPVEQRLIKNDLQIVSFEDTPNMLAGTFGFLDALGDLCRYQNYDIIYIDSFSDYTAGFDIRSEDHMRNVISKLREFTTRYNVSFRIIHHGTKPMADGSGGSMAGIHTIRDLVDTVIALSVDKDNKDVIRITSDQTVDPSAKARYKRSLDLWVKRISDEETYFSFVRKHESPADEDLRERILEAVREKQGITAGELKQEVGNYKDLVKIREKMVSDKVLRMESISSSRGKDTKMFFTMDYNGVTELNGAITEQTLFK